MSLVSAERVLVVSDYTSQAISTLFPFARKKLHVIRNGPSFPVSDYFTPHERPPRLADIGRYALMVGRLEHRKNVHLGVDAFRAAALSGVKLVVVGAPEPGYDTPKADEDVIFLSRISDNELAGIYQHADLFIYPSAAEGFGLPLLDALLFGIPSIASNQTAIPEIGGEFAVYFDPTLREAVTSLTALIRQHFVTQSIAAPTMAERKALADRFSWAASARSFLDIVEQNAENASQ